MVLKVTPESVSIRSKLFMKKISSTGKDMAKMGGVTEQAFSGYLTGKNLPASSVLAAWIQTVNMNVNWLLTGEGEMLRVAASEDNDTKIVDLLWKNRDLSRENRELRIELENLRAESRSFAAAAAPGTAAAARPQRQSNK